MDGLECTEKFGKLCGKDSGLTDKQINIVLNVKTQIAANAESAKIKYVSRKNLIF